MKPGFILYLIADGSPAHTQAVEAVLGGNPGTGVAVLLRMKGRPVSEIREAAEPLLAATRAARAKLFVHSEVQLAQDLNATGVHLSADDPRVAQARMLLPARFAIGVSCHDAVELERAHGGGASFVLLSPYAEVPEKAAPLGAEGFAQLRRDCPLSVVALGGIGPANVGEARAAGATAVAAIRSVLGAPDPAAAARSILEGFRDAAPAP